MTVYHQKTVAFIGGGNMASSIIGGLIRSGWASSQFRVAEPLPEQRQRLQQEFSVSTFVDNAESIEGANVVILATKPQTLERAITPISVALGERKPLVVSIVAGIRSNHILKWVGSDVPLVRVMPNTPALVNQGISGLYANRLTSKEDRGLSEAIMSAVGKVIWVGDEGFIDTVTGISGSGPAYFFKVMELMIQAGVEHGLDEGTARSLVVETALGAAALICESPLSLAALRKQVTSPGGTTEAGIRYMEKQHIEEAIKGGVNAAITRSVSLANEFGGGK